MSVTSMTRHVIFGRAPECVRLISAITGSLKSTFSICKKRTCINPGGESGDDKQHRKTKKHQFHLTNQEAHDRPHNPEWLQLTLPVIKGDIKLRGGNGGGQASFMQAKVWPRPTVQLRCIHTPYATNRPPLWVS